MVGPFLYWQARQQRLVELRASELEGRWRTGMAVGEY